MKQYEQHKPNQTKPSQIKPSSFLTFSQNKQNLLLAEVYYSQNHHKTKMTKNGKKVASTLSSFIDKLVHITQNQLVKFAPTFTQFCNMKWSSNALAISTIVKPHLKHKNIQGLLIRWEMCEKVLVVRKWCKRVKSVKEFIFFIFLGKHLVKMNFCENVVTCK